LVSAYNLWRRSKARAGKLPQPGFLPYQGMSRRDAEAFLI
jgi:hypothetical protein